MTISGPKKRCNFCGKAMQRWGVTKDGKQRWRCGPCRRSGTRKRKDNRHRKRLSFFLSWITSKKTIQQVAADAHVHRFTLQRWFETFFSNPPKPIKSGYPVRVLVLDGTSVQPRTCMMLIAADAARSAPVSWLPISRECHASWSFFLESMKKSGVDPALVVCDGQRGLLKAIPEVWPHALVQRCLIHVIRQSLLWITQRPKTRAGRDLLELVHQLPLIRTKRQKRRWLRGFKGWKRKYHRFLTERTESVSERWWYTHRKLRAVRSLIMNAIPDLFRFVSDPTVPRTSNHVEGGMNSRIKELYHSHRGLALNKKIALTSWYLNQRQERSKNQH